MKIEIITIHRLNNFGSAFQAWALYEYISNMGYEVEILDYHPSYYKGKKIKNIVGRIIFRKDLKERERKFDQFIENNTKLSKKRYTRLSELEKNYPMADLYISGGDQLWNYYHICGNDDAYKLTFWKGRKISYGTSLGGEKLTREQLSDLCRKLTDYEHISLRESKSVKLLKQNGIQAQWVVDPVMLLPKERYEKLLIKPQEKERYVFVYLTAPSSLLDESVEYLSHKEKLKVIVYAGFGHKCKCDIQERNLGPEEVLGYIRYADFVLSASFHATLFSIMFKKKFGVILPGEETNERILDLLSWTGLKAGLVKNKGAVEHICNQDNFYHDSLDDVIDRRIEESKQYLESSI